MAKKEWDRSYGSLLGELWRRTWWPVHGVMAIGLLWLVVAVWNGVTGP